MNLTDLKKALSTAEATSTQLLDELYAYCNAKGTGTEPETVFGMIPALAAKVWREAAEAYPYRRVRKSDKLAGMAGETNELIGNTFYVVPSASAASHRLYPIKDKAARTLSAPVEYNTLDSTAIAKVGRALNLALSGMGETPRYYEDKVVKRDLAAYFMTYTEDAPEPKLYAQPDDDCFCLARRDVLEDELAEFPDWQRFLSGFEDPEAFAAKVWAIVSGNDTSRQALVVRSSGKTGKSCVLNAISSVFGPAAKALAGTAVNQSSRFIASNYRDCALIYVPDTNSRTILLTDTVKMLTGSDVVQYEVKFGGFGEYKAKAKLIVFTNSRPMVLDEEHSISRILYLEQNAIDYVDMGSDEFTARLTDQLPGFLAYGRECFARKWQNNKITLNDKAQETFNLLIGSEKQEFYSWFGRNFTLTGDPTDAVSATQVNRALDRVKTLSKHDRQQWREWLEDMDEVTPTKTKRETYYGGMTLRASAMQSADSAAKAMRDA